MKALGDIILKSAYNDLWNVVNQQFMVAIIIFVIMETYGLETQNFEVRAWDFYKDLLR